MFGGRSRRRRRWRHRLQTVLSEILMEAADSRLLLENGDRLLME